MTMSIQAFVADIALNSMIHRNNPNRLTELNAIASALATDPTTHDTTIETAPAGLRPGQAPPINSKFQNDILAVVNIGKAGGLTPLAMGNAITAGLSSILPPANTAAPAVTGTATVGSTLTVHQRQLELRADELRLSVDARRDADLGRERFDLCHRHCGQDLRSQLRGDGDQRGRLDLDLVERHGGDSIRLAGTACLQGGRGPGG